MKLYKTVHCKWTIGQRFHIFNLLPSIIKELYQIPKMYVDIGKSFSACYRIGPFKGVDGL